MRFCCLIVGPLCDLFYSHRVRYAAGLLRLQLDGGVRRFAIAGDMFGRRGGQDVEALSLSRQGAKSAAVHGIRLHNVFGIVE